MTRLPDRYSSFLVLCKHETEGVDYRIHIEDRSSHVAIIAPMKEHKGQNAFNWRLSLGSVMV